SAARHRGRELVRGDGHRPGRHAAPAGVAAARGQSRPGRHRLGRLSYRVLSDLRLQIDRHGNAREGPIARGDGTVSRLRPAGTIQPRNGSCKPIKWYNLLNSLVFPTKISNAEQLTTVQQFQ